jgi:hypothetical protein
MAVGHWSETLDVVLTVNGSRSFSTRAASDGNDRLLHRGSATGIGRSYCDVTVTMLDELTLPWAS